MSAETPADGGAPADRASVSRVLLLTLVCLGVAGLAAAAFVLSYSAIHAFALQAGVQPRLARAYPVMIDAMLVFTLAAVLALGGAGLPSRLLAWTILVAVLAAAAGADALHADGRRLPDHVAAITVAILPWVLVLLAFVLLLAMLQVARLRRQAASSRAPTATAAGSGSPAHTDLAAQTGIGPHPSPASGAAPDLPRRPAEPAFTYGTRRRSPAREAALARAAASQQHAPPQDAELPATDSLWDRLAGPPWEAAGRPALQDTSPDADPPEGTGSDDPALDPVASTQTVDPVESATDTDGQDSSAAPLDAAPEKAALAAAEAAGTEPAETEPAETPLAEVEDSGAEEPEAEGPEADLAEAEQPEADLAGTEHPETEHPETEHPTGPAPDVPVQPDSVWERPSYHRPGSAADADDAADPDAASAAPDGSAGHEEDPDMPVFHRIWSTPTPPAEL